jgi:hypothetical protein
LCQKVLCDDNTFWHRHISELAQCKDLMTEQFSDSCIGQNRNTFVAPALLHAVCTSTYLKVVNHNFLEPGHKQMECDSMHSAMNMRKSKPIYMYLNSLSPCTEQVQIYVYARMCYHHITPSGTNKMYSNIKNLFLNIKIFVLKCTL